MVKVLLYIRCYIHGKVLLYIRCYIYGQGAAIPMVLHLWTRCCYI